MRERGRERLRERVREREGERGSICYFPLNLKNSLRGNIMQGLEPWAMKEVG